MENRYCVIMGGGIGSRFWPFSRNNRPKQFLDFFGIGRSLLQMSYDRFIKIIPKDHIFIVTNEIYVDLVKEQLPDIAEENILLEPTRRNTAPCIAWASYHIQALNPNANIVVAPSDHLILKEDEFAQCVNRGLDFVSKYPALLTLGIKPNRPETGYGYIQIGEDAEDNIKTVKTFTEKPNLEFAKMFVESGVFSFGMYRQLSKRSNGFYPIFRTDSKKTSKYSTRPKKNILSTKISQPAPVYR